MMQRNCIMDYNMWKYCSFDYNYWSLKKKQINKMGNRLYKKGMCGSVKPYIPLLRLKRK